MIISGFKKKELKRWSQKNLASGITPISDGLRCFPGIKEAGFSHEARIVGNSIDPKKSTAFNWVNTFLGNSKTVLSGICHKLSSTRIPRHLGTFQYCFNRRLVLGDMVNRLAFVSLQALPTP